MIIGDERDAVLRRILISLGLVFVVGSLLPGFAAAAPSNSLFQSAEVYSTSTGCSNTAALRNAANALDDA